MKYKKLISFDFDKTLFFTPEPELSKEIFLKKTGKNWPHKGWWGKSETLNMDIFDIPLNNWVYEKYLEVINDPETFTMMATGRLKKIPGMRENIDKIFEKYGMKFDEIHLNCGSDTLKFKIKLFEEKIEELRVDEFIMFDDRELHLIEFKEWAKSIDCKISIVDVINKKKDRFNYDI